MNTNTDPNNADRNPDTIALPTFAMLASQLEQAGFVAGVPAWLSKYAESVDRFCLRRMKCPNRACRHKGMEYLAYAGTPRRYVVLAVCPRCQSAEAF